MAVVHPSAPSATIEIAGTAWPVYKLEALAAGLVVGLILALVTGSPQIAVLAAAAIGATRWIVGLLATRRQAPRAARVFGTR
ncbi:hypothetical protein OH799_34655 [Nocardia sp. NBC_00881]|uniref:hypothetical protein n=1 Tax=Nocardia sp. NBC_00881 TaxID=2975995 RepID=UPI003868989A|nr:hypothetical protein OH799_34655 [Nocardia sp. NBC_00881]